MTSKSLWETLNFNEAVSTIANLTYISTGVTYARSANLHAILAISAYHLSKLPGNDISFEDIVVDWKDVVDAACQTAKRSLSQSLAEESSGQRKAKYKDQLMATLALFAFSVSYKLLI